MWASRRPLALLCCLALAACDRPMGRSDGISPVAGLAQRTNVAVHTVDPAAGYRQTPNPGGDGQRAAGVIERYQNVSPIPAPDSGSGSEQSAEGEG